MEEESDSQNRKTRSTVYLSTHSRTASVFVRNCSHRHAKCRRFFTGAHSNFHRHSRDTIIAAELAIKAFDYLIIAKGPGFQSFVELMELDYKTAGSPVRDNGRCFLGVDTFRHCFDGYYCRTNFTENRPCPVCEILYDQVTGEPYSACKNLAADGQRVRTKKCNLRGSPTVFVPGQSETVNCRDYSQACERLAWGPGGPSTDNGKARLTLNAVCLELLSTLREPNDSLAAILTPSHLVHLQTICAKLDSGIKGYSKAVDFLLVCYNRRATPEGIVMSDLERGVAEAMLKISHSQCEATALVPPSTLSFLKDVMFKSNNGGFSHPELARFRQDLGVRRSLLILASLGSRPFESTLSAISGTWTLHPVVESIFSNLATRVEFLLLQGRQMYQRVRVPDELRPPYDPTQGQAYFFCKSGRPYACWPEFTHVKSERTCSTCHHPDWQKKGANGMSEGIMSLACLDSYTIRGFHFMLGFEGKADASAAVFCNAPCSPATFMLDTSCQHAPYVNSRLGFFYNTLFMQDRWHRLKHVCRRIFDPDEFRRFDDKNTSFIEQWHSLQMILKKMVAGATMEHATFYASLLIDFHYNRRCDELGVPEARRCWPANM